MNRTLILMAALFLASPAVLRADTADDDVAVQPSPSPSPTPMSAHDRLVDQIAKLDAYLLDPRVPADKRQKLEEARQNLEAARLKLESETATSPTRR